MNDLHTPPDSDLKEEPIHAEYSTYVVTYVDVLGFADQVEESHTHPPDVAKIATLLSGLKHATSGGEMIHRDSAGQPVKVFRAFNFSDLTVRATRIPTGAKVSSTIHWEMFYLAELQLNLALAGYLVRGAITIGELYANEKYSIVFGPGLVRAYRLESAYAIYPRIVVDRKLLTTMKAEGVNPGDRGWQDYLGRGEDGVHFLDYFLGLSVTGFETGVPGTADPNSRICAHRDMIKEMIAEKVEQKNERIKQKYIWLAQYHNRVVAKLIARMRDKISGDLDSLVIPEDLLDF